MKPFRKHVALAIDGGGIKGVMAARALAILEEHLGQPAHTIFRLTAGTSTGSIISAALGAKLSAQEIHQLYCELGESVFRQTLRSRLWPLTRYRYSNEPLERALRDYLGNRKMGEYWTDDPATDVVITAFDLVDNQTIFIKPWKSKFAPWPVVRAVLASCTVPTYFPVVEGRYVDGGVGSYSNPCYITAYEACICLEWDPNETTLISLGTGRDPHALKAGAANRFWAWEWLGPTLGAFLQTANDQQVHLVSNFFEDLDFRRFQVDLREPIEMDSPKEIPTLTAYGDELGQKIINDETDAAQEIVASKPPQPSPL